MTSPLIRANDLMTLGRITLLDARPDREFQIEHPSGAVRVPVEDFDRAARDTTIGFADADHWTRAVRELGVDPAVAVPVVYDDGRMTEAARIWFLFQVFGVEARVLDGGLPALAGVCLGEVGPVSASQVIARPGAGRVQVVDRAELGARLGSVTILDARTEREFSGEDLRNNSRGGHLPGAHLVPHLDLLGTDGRLKDQAQLSERFAGAGIAKDRTVVTHCDAGGRAALAALALVEAGYRDVAAYYLSFSDRAADRACPVTLD
ncbi:sulfurtransferase [Chthonobacter albigriseus]|uniref:sulfurtransferase n=1 Tax=Chthonobacter albigriseus TaxID=1683161 RepID=UPI001FCE6D10|nr:rhodanese-like domain-containing protein [Chthonobacter albigriseus]